MAIHVEHTYSTHVNIIYRAQDGTSLDESTCGSMDDLVEHICDILVHHNFSGADVCDAGTGEVIMIVTRT